jgi:multimeric flavodoxin WrbA
MNIVAINGSHRGRKGYTQFLLDRLLAGATEAGALCETIVLAEKKINQCKGCLLCQTEKSFLRCVHEGKDDVADLFRIIRNADLLIYATPIYIFNLSGLMKIFLERMAGTANSSVRTVSDAGLLFHDIDKQLFSKPFVVITCQDNFEDETCKNVVNYFKTYSKFLDAPLVGILTRKSSGIAQLADEQKSEYLIHQTKRVNAAYFKAGAELATRGKITAATQKEANRNILPIPAIIDTLLRFKVVRKFRPFMDRIKERAA